MLEWGSSVGAVDSRTPSSPSAALWRPRLVSRLSACHLSAPGRSPRSKSTQTPQASPGLGWGKFPRAWGLNFNLTPLLSCFQAPLSVNKFWEPQGQAWAPLCMLEWLLFRRLDSLGGCIFFFFPRMKLFQHNIKFQLNTCSALLDSKCKLGKSSPSKPYLN